MEAAGGPVSTFSNLMTEGTQLCRLGEYDKALICYNNALQLREGDRDCLAARSNCYLKLGDTENALKDAEASLQNDKTFFKGLYQKAEALYTMCDFEFALVHYHRGHRLRPDQEKFKLGIEKCQEAIVNCVGSPSSVKLEIKKDVNFISRQAEIRKANEKLSIKLTKAQKRAKKQKPVRNPKIERQLLGDLYDDRLYLEELLKDKDLMESSTKKGTTVGDLVSSGISYLEKRREFWQQQEPIYARVRERRLRQQRWIREKKLKPSEVGRYITKSMEDIDMLLTGEDPEESCKKAKRLLRTIQEWSDEDVPNKNELIGNLHSCIGNAQLEMGQVEAALKSHRTDLEVARQNWEEKIPLAKSSLEKTWLFHEIGQCYLELNRAEEARYCGQKSLQTADEEGNVKWQYRAIVLVAQAEVKLKNYWSAIINFEKALEKAKFLHNDAARAAIIAALDDVSRSFVKGLNKTDETTFYSAKGGDFSDTDSEDNFQMYGETKESEEST
ncbi:tetratricopeptide repeat protein 25 isoform X2 [Calypte anna]|uniref:tetratricopeptide repeat protein 25 isoform X2 n=1 Tax=Calypte anna TaxID=9244 RepID=UPI0011C3D100|nr:tetratricopeptide repeat protein 25 isoform X2 [Calypte anna]